MPRLADLLDNPDFQRASPEARAIVFDRIASGDEDYSKASPEAQAIVKSRLLGGGTKPTRPKTTVESVQRELDPYGLLKPENAVRVGLPLAGSALFGIPGAAAGMVGGYLGGQLLSGEPMNWKTALAEGLLGLVPFGKQAKTVLGTLGKRALQGAGFGFGGTTLRTLAEEGRTPTAEELVAPVTVGTGLGLLTGGVEARLRPRQTVAPPTVTPTPTETRVPLALPPAGGGSPTSYGPSKVFAGQPALTGREIVQQRAREIDTGVAQPRRPLEQVSQGPTVGPGGVWTELPKPSFVEPPKSDTTELHAGLPLTKEQRARVWEGVKRYLASGKIAASVTPAPTPVLTQPPGAPVPPPTPFETAQEVLREAVKKARPVRAKTELLYSQERGKRLAAAVAAREAAGGGEKGFFAFKRQLRDPLPRPQFEPFVGEVGATHVKSLYDGIASSPRLSEYDKLTAQEGLSKLLGTQGAAIPTKGELALLSEVFDPKVIKEVLAKRHWWPKLMDQAAQIAALPKALKSMGELSAGLRQGLTALPAFPKEWGKAFMSQFKYAGSQKAYEALRTSIQTDPMFDQVMKAKPALTAFEDPLLTMREEQFISRLPSRIPVFKYLYKASERGYLGFLTQLRFDATKSLIKDAERAQLPLTDKNLQDMGKVVNTLTGRGSLGDFEAAAGALNTALFSPRLLASRFNLLWPSYYIHLNPIARKAALRGALGLVGMGSTVLGLAGAAGLEVGDDRRSANYGKVVSGNTRWDIWGGFGQIPRILTQLIKGEVVSSTTGGEIALGEGYKPLTRKKILERFLESKSNPVIGTILELLEGRTFENQPVSVTEELIDLFVPLFYGDLADLYLEDPKLLPWATPGFFGVGIQTYGGEKSAVRQLAEKVEDKFTGTSPLP